MSNQIIAALGIPRVESEPKGLGISVRLTTPAKGPSAENPSQHLRRDAQLSAQLRRRDSCGLEIIAFSDRDAEAQDENGKTVRQLLPTQVPL